MRHDGDVAPGEQGEDDDDGPGIGLTRGVANRIASVRPSQLRISPSEGQVAIARSVGLIRSIDIVMFLLLLVASNYLTQSQASLQPKCGGLGRASRPGGARQPAWRRNRDTIGVPHGTPAGEVPPQRSSHPPPPCPHHVSAAANAQCIQKGCLRMHLGYGTGLAGAATESGCRLDLRYATPHNVLSSSTSGAD